jgi:hypothetical protein
MNLYNVKYINTYIYVSLMKGVKYLKLKNYLNTIYSKNHIIHEFDNVHTLGIKDVHVYFWGLSWKAVSSPLQFVSLIISVG